MLTIGNKHRDSLENAHDGEALDSSETDIWENPVTITGWGSTQARGVRLSTESETKLVHRKRSYSSTPPVNVNAVAMCVGLVVRIHKQLGEVRQFALSEDRSFRLGWMDRHRPRRSCYL